MNKFSKIFFFLIVEILCIVKAKLFTYRNAGCDVCFNACQTNIVLNFSLRLTTYQVIQAYRVLGFKLSPCSESLILSSGWFPGVWILYANVSEHSVSSIFIAELVWSTRLWRWNRQCVPKSWHLNYIRWGIIRNRAYKPMQDGDIAPKILKTDTNNHIHTVATVPTVKQPPLPQEAWWDTEPLRIPRIRNKLCLQCGMNSE
jgi:ferredoxin